MYSRNASFIALCAYIPDSLHVHAIGASETGATLEIEMVNPEGQENNSKSEARPAGPEDPKEEVECQSHDFALFVKDKPQSILSLPLYFTKHE